MEIRTGTFVGVLFTALLWGFVWALPGGGIEALDNITSSAHGFTRQMDMWMQTLGLPGVVGGVLFSVLLLVSDRRRPFAELALSRAIGWGVVAGVTVAALVVWVVDWGFSESGALTAAALGYGLVMGGAAGLAAVVVSRYAGRKPASARS